MGRKNKALMRTIVSLAVPCVLSSGFFFVMLGISDIRRMLLLLHILTLVWAGFFLKNKFSRVSVLPVSFLLSLATPFLYDSLHPGRFQYLRTAAMAAMYALPWAAVTLIVAAVVLMRQKSKRRKTIDYEL